MHMARGVLILALLLGTTVAAAESFVESFEADEDQNHVPDFWDRAVEPGLPRFNEIVYPDREVRYAGASSVRLRTHGGSMLLRCERYLAVNPALVYELSARIRTRGFDRNVAWVSVAWYDRTGTLLGTQRTDGVGGTHDWSRVDLRFEGLSAATRFVRLALGVDGGDLAGEAWFDEITWTESVSLLAGAPGHPGNVFNEGESIQFLVSSPTLERGRYTVRARAIRFDGSPLAPIPSVELLVGKGETFETQFALPIDETGYFDIWIDIVRGEEVLASRLVPLGIVPRVRSRLAINGEFGVVIDPFHPLTPRILTHLESLPLGRAKVLMFDRRDPAPAAAATGIDPVAETIVALRRLGADPIGVLAPPARARPTPASQESKIDGFADWCGLPETAWQPAILDAVAQRQGYVARWQLGADRDFRFQTHADGAALLARALAVMAQSSKVPIVGVSVDPQVPQRAAGLQFRSVEWDADGVTTETVPAIAGALQAEPPAVLSIHLPEAAIVDRYAGLRGQIVSLVKSVVLARVGGARDCYVYPLVGAQTGLFDAGGDPTPAYFAVRTLNQLLSGSQVDARRYIHDRDVVNYVFERSGERVIALWMESGRTPRELVLPLGAEARVFDPTGRLLEVPADGINRRLTVGDVPLFLADLDGGLVATLLGMRFQGRQVRLQAGRQRETLFLTNGFSSPLLEIEARVRLPEAARGWRFDLLERRRARLDPGETWAIPVEIELPQNESVDVQPSMVELRFQGPERIYDVRVPRALELRSDILLDLTTKRQETGVVQVALTVRNASDRVMDLKCYLFAEGRPVEPRLLPRVAPGSAEVLRFTLSRPQGKLRAHVEEIRGSAFCNKEIGLE